MADLVMLGFIAGFLRGGWSSGFVRRLFGLVFLAISFVAGAFLRTPAGALVHTFLPKIPEQYAEMVGYSVAFSALLIIFNLFSSKILSRVATGGLSKELDKALGLIFGGLEAILILSAAIVILHTYTDPGSATTGISQLGFLHDIRTAVDDSTIGKLLEDTTVPLVLLLLGPFLPTDIKSIVPTTIPGGLPGFPLPGLPGPTPTHH
ncbi:MAG TPA: CvpA family protein [Candidatus Limnocylindrales bacterium]|nr:CvpA family protein [Candidatus Limnocylindrales bacterium]